MSHPWKAQPYYLVQQPRTSGTVPAPLGSFGVRAALAGYTRGVFAPKSPWNVPKYVAAEPTGVDGFRGFGEEPACLSPAEAAAALLPAVRSALSQITFTIPSVPLIPAELKGARVGALLGDRSKLPDATLLDILKPVVVQLAAAMRSGHDALVVFLKDLFKKIVAKLPGGNVITSTSDTVLATFGMSDLWGTLARQAVNGLLGTPPPNLCAPTAVDVTPTTCVQLPDGKWHCVREGSTPGLQMSVYTGPLPPSLEEQRRQLVATGLRVAKLKLATPTPVAAPVKKTSPLFIVGAAALAALLLLKKK